MPHSTPPTENFLIRLLTEGRFRLHRHLLLGFMIFTIALNSGVLAQMSDSKEFHFVYLATGMVTFITYLAIAYLNIYVLVPRFLMKDNYAGYVITTVSAILTVVSISVTFEYVAIHHFGMNPGRYSYFNPNRAIGLDIVTEFVSTGICLTATTISMLIRQWILSGERINELEINTLKTEAEQMKDRMSPSFLFSVLDHAAHHCTDSPGTSSDMVPCPRPPVHPVPCRRILNPAIRFLNTGTLIPNRKRE